MQIENVLTEHADIREAAAVSVPCSKYGEVVGAWIVLEPGSELSREKVRDQVAQNMNPQVRNVALFNCDLSRKLTCYQNAPAWVWFLGEEGVPSELPKTASGKVQKHILRNWSKELVRQQFGLVGR